MKQNKLIKILHTEWSDGWGGQEIRIINEMCAVREKGVQVFLACKENAIIKEKALQNNIEVFTLGFKGNADFKTLFALRKIIKKHRIDIVNTHSGKDTWVGGLAAKCARVKFIRTRHLSNKINPSRLNFINTLADHILTTGSTVREHMIAYNRIKPENITSIPTGVDEIIFDPSRFDKLESRKKINIAADEIAIGIVAVLRSSKRHDNFITIANRLTQDFPEKKFKFIIAGEGSMRSNIEQQIQESNANNILMLGHIDNVSELLSALDIFLFTADSREGVPQAVMQALCMNLQVITTNDGATKDVHSNHNCIITETDIESLYQGIYDLLSNTQQIIIDRAIVIEKFSLSKLTTKLLGIYNKILTY